MVAGFEQAALSAILAPSLRMVADSLSLTWRAQLTAAANKRYLKGNTFYTVTALGGMTVGSRNDVAACDFPVTIFALDVFNKTHGPCASHVIDARIAFLCVPWRGMVVELPRESSAIYTLWSGREGLKLSQASPSPPCPCTLLLVECMPDFLDMGI